MRNNRRFEQLETGGPEEEKKPSFFQRWSFKRKLEITGVAREALPEAAPEVRPPTPVPVQPVAYESKVELERTFAEIEEADIRRKALAEQRLNQEIQQKRDAQRRVQLQEAQARVERAKYRIFWGVVILGVFGFLTYFVGRTVGTDTRRESHPVFLIIFAVIAGLLGGRRRWWDRW